MLAREQFAKLGDTFNWNGALITCYGNSVAIKSSKIGEKQTSNLKQRMFLEQELIRKIIEYPEWCDYDNYISRYAHIFILFKNNM